MAYCMKLPQNFMRWVVLYRSPMVLSEKALHSNIPTYCYSLNFNGEVRLKHPEILILKLPLTGNMVSAHRALALIKQMRTKPYCRTGS